MHHRRKDYKTDRRKRIANKYSASKVYPTCVRYLQRQWAATWVWGRACRGPLHRRRTRARCVRRRRISTTRRTRRRRPTRRWARGRGPQRPRTRTTHSYCRGVAALSLDWHARRHRHQAVDNLELNLASACAARRIYALKFYISFMSINWEPLQLLIQPVKKTHSKLTYKL